VGFGGILTADPSSTRYGKLPSFDSSVARADGFPFMRYNFPNGWFIGVEASGIGFSMSGNNNDGAFGNNRSLNYQGMQFGYTFQNGGLPVTLYAGFDTFKYNVGIGSPFARFDSVSSTLPGYTAHAGVEFQPAANVSLSLGFGYTQQSGHLDSDLNPLSLPGPAPFGLGARR
jgi:opacity protein-like surface antigen